MPDEGEQKVQLGPVSMPEHLRPTYANFVNVNHTPWDFRLLFAVVRTPMPGEEAAAAQEAGAVRPQGVAEVILPANLMHGLIAALQTNFSTYLDQFGPPGMEPEGPTPRSEA